MCIAELDTTMFVTWKLESTGQFKSQFSTLGRVNTEQKHMQKYKIYPLSGGGGDVPVTHFNRKNATSLLVMLRTK